MLENIPRKRLLFYGLFIGLLPLIFVALHFYSQLEKLNHLKETIHCTHDTAIMREKKQATNMAVIQHFREADHHYIDKYLESLVFLETEIESLQKLENSKNFAFDDALKKRLEHLTNNNSLAFTEGVVQSYPLFQETTETLVHPVEVDVEDIQKILSRIEAIPIGPYAPPSHPPQLLILDFKINRKNISENNEAFSLDLKLLKREFL
ncbi:hypothetical protein [Neochlamydia sp. EPS4]|uniref:hypothetical protein n=1 Tax=Neochlamydia sp. EPS4 TaxID=1478175 RepID=UPI0005D0F355|nr:hypothetical protein [Neochlamydia sp. EPS4]